MQRIDGPTVSATPPSPPVEQDPGYFTEGNPGLGTPATEVSGWWLHSVQEEILAVLDEAGITPDIADVGQLRDAILALIVANTPPVSKGVILGRFAHSSASQVVLAPTIEGKVWVEILDTVYTAAAPITFDITSHRHADTSSEAAAKFYYCYLHPVAGVLTPKISQTAPTVPYGYHPTSADHRHVGTFYNNGASDIVPFVCHRRVEGAEYLLQYRALPANALPTANPGTANYLAFGLTNQLPTTARAMLVEMDTKVKSFENMDAHYGDSTLVGLSSNTFPGPIQHDGQMWLRVDGASPQIAYAHKNYTASDALQFSTATIKGWRE